MGEFGVSRTVVREAIYASRRPGSWRPSKVAARSCSPSRDHAVLGPGLPDPLAPRHRRHDRACGSAWRSRLPAWPRPGAPSTSLKAIERALLEYKRIGENPNKGVEADYTFHVKVAAASGNRFISDLLTSLGPMMIMLPRTRLKPAYTISDASHFTRVTLEHENIYLSIAEGDAEAARAAMRLHLSNTRHRLQKG